MILAGLVRLALLRALRPAACVLSLALLAWALATSRASSTALLSAGSDLAPLWEHGALRAAAWTIAALFFTGWLGLQALATLSGWRRRDVDWMAPRGASGTALVLSTWIGLLAAALLLGLATASAVEFCASRGRASWIEGPRAFAGAGGWVESGTASRDSLATGALPRGARLRLSFAFASGGPDVRVCAVLAERPGGAELARTEQSVGTRGELELVLPDCPAGAELRLTTTDPELRVYHDAAAARVWLPVAHEGLASISILARLVLDVGACCAIALAFSGWFSTAGAVFTLASLALIALLSSPDPGWLPLAGLGRALAVLQEGRVPAWPSLAEIAGAAALSAAGLALAAGSLVRWRRER
jgi:hypothetical protein